MPGLKKQSGSRSGVCLACGQVMAKSGIPRHLESCEKRREKWALRPTGRGKIRSTFLVMLSIEGRYNPEYWIRIEIPSDARLLHLDRFLRDFWLECCGHLSAFNEEIATPPSKRKYPEPIAMGVTIAQAFAPERPVFYTYDFGSSTELVLTAVGIREAQARDGRARVLARNLPPEIPCYFCGKPATQVAAEIAHEPEAWVCDAHVKKLSPDLEFLLPVTNSPRVGVCAYSGPLPYIGPRLWLE